MLSKTRGIVLKVTDYSESSVVARIFTDQFGLQSYLINGVKKPKAKIRLNMLQPLHLLDMVVYHKAGGGIQKVSELRNVPLFSSIPYDIIKSSLALFLNEIIYKSVKEQQEDPALFEFIFKSVEFLDETQESIANFHLCFLVKLSRYLGFYPDMSYADTSVFFDLKDGIFTNAHPPHAFFIKDEALNAFTEILRIPLHAQHTLSVGKKCRKEQLSKLLDFYALHIDNLGAIQSVGVLEELWS